MTTTILVIIIIIILITWLSYPDIDYYHNDNYSWSVSWRSVSHYDHQHHFHFTSPSLIGLTAPSHRTSRRSDTSPMIPIKSTTTWVTRITTRLKWRTWSVKPSTLPNTTVHPQELIKKYGAKNFNFHQYRAHYHGQVRKGDKPFNPLYEPPGYQADIASGIYQPDQERPQVKNF